MAAGNPKLFERFCAALDIPEVLKDERFSEHARRHRNERALEQRIEQALSRFNREEALALLGGADIPCAPIHTVDRVLADPQVKARDRILEVTHPVAGVPWLAGLPSKTSPTRGAIGRPAPTFGQHAEQVLGRFPGLTREQAGGLRGKKIV